MIISWFLSSSFWYRCFVWMCRSSGFCSESSVIRRVLVHLVGQGSCIDRIRLHSSSDGCKVVTMAYSRCDESRVCCSWINWAMYGNVFVYSSWLVCIFFRRGAKF